MKAHIDMQRLACLHLPCLSVHPSVRPEKLGNHYDIGDHSCRACFWKRSESSCQFWAYSVLCHDVGIKVGVVFKAPSKPNAETKGGTADANMPVVGECVVVHTVQAIGGNRGSERQVV